MTMGWSGGVGWAGKVAEPCGCGTYIVEGVHTDDISLLQASSFQASDQLLDQGTGFGSCEGTGWSIGVDVDG